MSDNTPASPDSAPEPEDQNVLPSGARIENTAADDPDAPKKVSRRGLLTGVGIGAAVVLAGGLGGWAFIASQPKKTANGLAVTTSWADKEIKITSPSGVCEAPLVVAYEKGFFDKAGLNVKLLKTGDGENVVEAVGSGKYTASNGIFFNYLDPIYNGTPVKLSGGLHYGCLDLYVKSDGDITKVADLKGKKIGVTSLQGSSTNFFSLDLLDAGINSSPEAKQVEWVVITDQTLLPQALKDGKVDAIATAGGFLPIIQAVKDGWATEISNNRNLSKNADEPCCAVVLNNTFVSQDPVTAAKLVTAWAQGSRWAGANLEATAELESGKYVAGKPEEILPVLKTLTFRPSPKNLHKVLEPGIEKYIKTGFLPKSTNAKALADKAFVDLGLNF
ncbi:ABC transporter substrate-binding protein [Gryllotalpicola koreensis]|uniref:ABC transporter substrate-binding protein n=1 Tax=Gryllotalpicola koreensis TaxID=993086 RepID=A0ABP8A623_9MICO